MRGPGDEPRPVNEKILDAAIAHAFLVERFKSSEVRRIVRLLDRDVIPSLFARLQARLERIRVRGYDVGPETTKSIREMLAASDKVLARGMRKVYGEMRDGLVDFAKAESAWQAKAIGDAIPVKLDLTTPSPRILRSVVVSRPFQGKNLRAWWKTVDQSTRQAVRSNVQIGIAQGETTDQIVRRLRGTRRNNFTDGAMQATRRNASFVVRTATNHVSTHAREATYAENDDVVDKVQLVSVLDTRTTLTCVHLDSKVFPINKGPRPPHHGGCRGTTTPVTKPFRELGIDLDEIPAGTRASMDGQVPASLNSEQWLKAQPRDRQLQVLGPARLKLFQRGVPLKRMLNARGDELTVQQILEREGIDPTSVLGGRAA